MERFLHKDSPTLRGGYNEYVCVVLTLRPQCVFVISVFSIFHKRLASKQNKKFSFD